MEQWTILPTNTPHIIRNCSKCGNGSSFLCSGNFRINANGRNIDVWLIYKCRQCDSTWNMEILSRVKPQQIESKLYQAFLRNDKDTADKYACDAQTLAHHKAVTYYGDVEYSVVKTQIGDADGTLTLHSPYDLGIRLDKLLSDELKLSRTRIKSQIEDGIIASTQMTITAKTKVKGTIIIKGITTNE